MTDDHLLVALIDDDPAIHDSLRSLFGSVDLPLRVFAQPDDFLAADLPDVATCLVLDVRLPGKSGLEFQRELSRLGRDLPIVFITGHGDIPMSVEAMKAGAIEFLTKPFRDQELLDAVNRGLALDGSRRERSARFNELRARYDSLTPRERDVMALVTEGLLNKQIAAKLGLSIVTVKVHRAHVMRKMQASTLADLVRISDVIGIASRKA